MISGFETALGEITLVLFTTLAPTGALAVLCMGLPLIFGSATDRDIARLNKYLCIPLVVSMVGLIASATHLGNPANALYVFASIGTSPLSNEVFAAVLFLASTGLYWLYSFSEKAHRTLLRIWFIVISFTAIAFVVSVGFAYSSRTIISWHMWQAPVAVMCNALVGGPLLTLMSYACAGCQLLNKRKGVQLLVVSVGAFLVNAIVYVLQIRDVFELSNSMASVSELVPLYWWALFAFVVLVGAALVLAWNMIKRLPADPHEEAIVVASRSNMTLIVGLCVATILCLAGIFIMRFCFYMSHITVGLGV
ncbi:dimethyl sulfoxide reductase anchor subunit family protein [Adlercreutzia agrestimuris]|uniref:dimethyl sulfoxide reductase anchor subunit family protein n=1 Tax=Adlercreutzia agrestimuris TaxID=2941324 RepID=UPI00203D73EB|nr:DmsC/YnfH family molybdoenzyme membrane anchor subunit [Adlercreutzia agrestimuris]